MVNEVDEWLMDLVLVTCRSEDRALVCGFSEFTRKTEIRLRFWFLDFRAIHSVHGVSMSVSDRDRSKTF